MSVFITRKNNQGVSIGDLYIKVHSQKDGQVKLEIDAPPGTLIIEDEAFIQGTDPFDEELAFLEASLASA